ncbi:ankyrin repeat-containing domain protein, partial [Dunaliella salina]
GLGAGTVRPPVDDPHKGSFPPGSIFYACQKGDLPGLKLIVDEASQYRIAAATCSVKEDVMGLSPLHVAAEAGQLEIVEFLLRANVEAKCENKFLVTPLHLAALEGHIEICAALIDAQAPLAAQDVAGDQPIHWATTKGRDQVIKLLLKAGSPLDTPNYDGWTPLHRAAYAGEPAAARVLIDAGANLSARTRRGDIPLHLACFSNAVTAMEELIKQNNYDRNARNCQGLTPFGMCLTDEARVLMHIYGAEAATDRVRPSQQDGDVLQQHLARWHAAAMEEGAPGFGSSAQHAACVSRPPQELEKQGQGEGIECDISSAEGDVDMERVSAELLKITMLKRAFPDPEDPEFGRPIEDTRCLGNAFLAEVSSGFSATNPYDLLRGPAPSLGVHSHESYVIGAPALEGPSSTDTPASSSPASSAFPSKRASMGGDAPCSSNNADPPVPIAAQPSGEPRNGRRERPRGPTKLRPSIGFNGLACCPSIVCGMSSKHYKN